MAFHRELVVRDGAHHLILGMVPGNFDRLIAGDMIDFAIDGMRVTIVYGRTPASAGAAMQSVKAATDA